MISISNPSSIKTLQKESYAPKFVLAEASDKEASLYLRRGIESVARDLKDILFVAEYVVVGPQTREGEEAIVNTCMSVKAIIEDFTNQFLPVLDFEPGVPDWDEDYVIGLIQLTNSVSAVLDSTLLTMRKRFALVMLVALTVLRTRSSTDHSLQAGDLREYDASFDEHIARARRVCVDTYGHIEAAAVHFGF